jgi:hypothetical protein
VGYHFVDYRRDHLQLLRDYLLAWTPIKLAMADA